MEAKGWPGSERAWEGTPASGLITGADARLIAEMGGRVELMCSGVFTLGEALWHLSGASGYTGLQPRGEALGRHVFGVQTTGRAEPEKENTNEGSTCEEKGNSRKGTSAWTLPSLPTLSDTGPV